jgi:hypothetical protein
MIDIGYKNNINLRKTEEGVCLSFDETTTVADVEKLMMVLDTYRGKTSQIKEFIDKFQPQLT